MTDLLDEEWRPIPDFPGYSVSNLGRIRSEERVSMRGGKPMRVPGGIIRTSPTNGYPRFNARRDGRSIQLFVHQVVMLAFVGPPGPRQEVLHRDGDRGNARLDNLEYGTRAQNIEDAKRHGTFPVLEKRYKAILTREQAVAIVESRETAAELGRRYGVAEATIRQIRSGQTWASVTEGKRPTSYRPVGAETANARLTEEQVRDILTSRETLDEVSARLGVHRNTVFLIRKRRTWKHVSVEQSPGGNPASGSPDAMVGGAAE